MARGLLTFLVERVGNILALYRATKHVLYHLKEFERLMS